MKRKESFYEKLTPRMTEQSHKKRFTVIYEIINQGVALGNRKKVRKKLNPFWGCSTRDFCNFVYILHAAGECKFEAIS